MNIRSRRRGGSWRRRRAGSDAGRKSTWRRHAPRRWGEAEAMVRRAEGLVGLRRVEQANTSLWGRASSRSRSNKSHRLMLRRNEIISLYCLSAAVSSAEALTYNTNGVLCMATAVLISVLNVPQDLLPTRQVLQYSIDCGDSSVSFVICTWPTIGRKKFNSYTVLYIK